MAKRIYWFTVMNQMTKTERVVRETGVTSIGALHLARENKKLLPTDKVVGWGIDESPEHRAN